MQAAAAFTPSAARAANTMQVGSHVVTNILVRHLSERVKNVLEIIKLFVGLIFSILLAISAWQLTIKNYVRDTTVFGALDTPVWIPNLIFLIGSTVFFFEMLVLLSKAIKREA